MIGGMSKVKKIIAEAEESKNPELDLVDKGIASFDELPGVCKLLFVMISLTIQFFIKVIPF